MKSLFLIVLSLIFLSSVFAQKNTVHPVSPSSVVFIDSSVFNDKKLGIPKLAEAYEKIEIQLKLQSDELKNLVDKYNALLDETKEILKKDPGIEIPEPYYKKAAELSKMQEEALLKSAKLKILQEKLFTEFIQPIDEDIKKYLEQFATQNNYKVVLDKSSINESFFSVYSLNYVDVTNDFIKFYNAAK